MRVPMSEPVLALAARLSWVLPEEKSTVQPRASDIWYAMRTAVVIAEMHAQPTRTRSRTAYRPFSAIAADQRKEACGSRAVGVAAIAPDS